MFIRVPFLNGSINTQIFSVVQKANVFKIISIPVGPRKIGVVNIIINQGPNNRDIPIDDILEKSPVDYSYIIGLFNDQYSPVVKMNDYNWPLNKPFRLIFGGSFTKKGEYVDEGYMMRDGDIVDTHKRFIEWCIRFGINPCIDTWDSKVFSFIKKIW